MSDTAEMLRLELADRIETVGWRKALEMVPRERFLGDAVYRPDETQFDLWTPVRRADMPEGAWLALAYADETWVTQVAGTMAEDTTKPVRGNPSSSSTLPSLVVRMLEAAEIEEGDKVLEIGTGTGYSTALMCQRIGNNAVVSIEYDPAVAARARNAIVGAGYAPTLVEGDGLRGYPQGGRYDRLVATCSVRTIPEAWPQQMRAGGTITAPLCGWMGETAFAHLTAAGDGTAVGRFLKDDLCFMTARSHVPPARPRLVKVSADARKSRIDPEILQDRTAVWVAQLAVPQALIAWGESATYLVDPSTGSRAEATSDAAGGRAVRQHGPLRLWDEIEKAIITWQEAGEPRRSDFGLTVTPGGQWVWLGDPGGATWNLPG
ncbi:ATP-grasp peptide maturase system methyltransferase [Nonomuraea sp. NPDC050404]|uniref:ATP-grasp peptide maturase system methyltransferase n=1 Tax=Nonomuraea sp. NPDC050404 TaxID=3155783 RepID=UPI0033F97FCA